MTDSQTDREPIAVDDPDPGAAADDGNRGPWIALAALAVVLVGGIIAVVLFGGGSDDGATDDRQAEVAERGALVMPFDLETTTHEFVTTDEGGVQTVTVDPDGEADTQVPLIREHLEAEAEAFRAGDFRDPMAIHGGDMPGVAALQDGIASIDVSYTEVDGGATVTYTTSDPALVDAIHDFFAAQLRDHGAHAVGG
jgi:hypothetical protein